MDIILVDFQITKFLQLDLVPPKGLVQILGVFGLRHIFRTPRPAKRYLGTDSPPSGVEYQLLSPTILCTGPLGRLKVLCTDSPPRRETVVILSPGGPIATCVFYRVLQHPVLFHSSSCDSIVPITDALTPASILEYFRVTNTEYFSILTYVRTVSRLSTKV